MLIAILPGSLALVVLWALNILVVQPFFSPLKNLPGPEPKRGLGFQGHLKAVLESVYYASAYPVWLLICLYEKVRVHRKLHMKSIRGSMEGISGSKDSRMSVHSPLSLCAQWYVTVPPRQFEDRLLTTDPVALTHVMNQSTNYQKPWQSRRIITRLIGEGKLPFLIQIQN